MCCPGITVDFHRKWSRIVEIINKYRVEKMFEKAVKKPAAKKAAP